MNKKRGILLVLVILLFSGLVQAAVLKVNTDRHSLLGRDVEAPTPSYYCDEGSNPHDVDCWEDEDSYGLFDGENVEYIGQAVFDEGEYVGIYLKEKNEIDDADGCSKDDDYKNYVKLGTKGCNILLVEQDDCPQDCNGDDDAAIGTVKIGSILDRTYTSYGSNIIGKLDDYIKLDYYNTFTICDNDDAQTGLKWAYFRTDNPYICSDDKFWHKCVVGTKSSEKKEGDTTSTPSSSGSIWTYTWANNILYNCTVDSYDQPYWEKVGTDKDQDGLTTEQGDCDDDPSDDPQNCPFLDIKTGKIDCKYPEHSKCAICINPAAPEVCGDGLNNDCGGDKANELITVLSGNSPDSCHENEYACEQKSKTDSEGKTIGPYYNIRGESLSWKKINNKGYCCGYDGLNDLGKIGTTSEGDFLCLNSDIDLVGRKDKYIPGWPGKSTSVSSSSSTDSTSSGSSTTGSTSSSTDTTSTGTSSTSSSSGSTTSTPSGTSSTSSSSSSSTSSSGSSTTGTTSSGNLGCDGNWCWVWATGNAAFNVLTIKKPGQSAYDVVSNSEEWVNCNSGSSSTLKIPLSQGDKTVGYDSISNRFYCYQEGNHWSWAECYGKNSDQKNSGTIKGRFEGEGLYNLYLDKANKDGELYGTTLEISTKNGNFADFYTDDYFDFSNYDYLELMVKFVSDSKGTSMSSDKLVLPANIFLQIYGPDQQSLTEKRILYFNQSILGYVTNGPFFGSDNWMRVKIPITDYNGIKLIKFQSEPEGNIIGIKNVYLSKSKEKTILCSGEDSRSYSSWLTDLDQSKQGNPITGEKLCTALYGKNAWLGDYSKNEVDKDSASCCGNNDQEYYSGSSETKYGCWNSQPINNKDTAMNIEFKATFQEEKIGVDYTSVPFTYTVTYAYPGGYEFNQTNTSSISIIDGFKSVGGISNNFIPLLSDQKWGNIKGYGSGKNTASSLNPSKVPKTLSEFYQTLSSDSAIKSLSVIKNPTLNKEGTSVVLLDESGEDTEFSIWVAWFYTEFDFTKSLNVKYDDTLSYSFASGCELTPEGEYKTGCTFNTNAVGTLTEKTINLDFKKGWNILAFYLDNRGGSNFYLSYSSQDNKFLEGDSRFTYMSSKGISSPSKLKVTSSLDDVDIEMYDYFTGFFSNELTGLKGQKKIIILASTDKVSINSKQITSNTSTFTYSCLQSECLYPLPGLPTYQLTNLHPELYDLYFVNSSGEYFIDRSNQQFTGQGNLKVKKVAQQIIYINEENSSTSGGEKGFYGCQAASFISNLKNNEGKSVLSENKEYCAVKGDKFCAYSFVSNQSKYAIINSWSSESLSLIGYKEVAAGQSVPNTFELLNETVKSTSRNHSTTAVPGRNIISNAEWELKGKDLLYWDILKDNQLVTDESSYLNTNKTVLILPTDQKVRSDRIAVGINQDLSFSQDRSSPLTIILVDKDGQSQSVNTSLSKFNSGKASYLILEFSGPGEIEKPNLQLIDDLGLANYSYVNQYSIRSGASCCPKDYCWNGYACVKEMSKFTYMTEKVDTAREYRCVQGAWTYLPAKWDWNFYKSGYCNQKDQCFVLSSLDGGDSSYQVTDFYQGKIPICINNSEYILDHYCDNGNWTSRTKFLADTLLDFAGSDDYVLYCTNYQKGLLDYKTVENYLGGSTSTQISTKSSLGDSITNTTNSTQLVQACFPQLLGGTKEKLVAETENTCINNVCLLNYKEGGKFKTLFATTLNKEINDTSSFLTALNVPSSQLASVCSNGTGFTKCDASAAGINGEIWYSEDIQGLIYSSESISLGVTTWGKVKQWFFNLFGGSELSKEKQLVKEATTFRNIYLMDKDNKQVRVIEEIYPTKKTLVAEYENFQTPVCDYVKYITGPAEIQQEILETASGMQKFNCTKNSTTQRFVAVAGLDFWWPQLTGSLRLNE